MCSGGLEIVKFDSKKSLEFSEVDKFGRLSFDFVEKNLIKPSFIGLLYMLLFFDNKFEILFSTEIKLNLIASYFIVLNIFVNK